MSILLSLALGPVLHARTPDETVPAWRGKSPGTAWQGPDVLWRPREWVIFNLLDETGGGFELNFTARDMNVYMQGPRPAFFLVIGPKDEIVAQTILEDDGIVSGNERYRDGIYDPFQDLRYREYHHHVSPNGYPAGKERSPLLDNPQTLPARHVSLNVPQTAKAGLYRVVVIASWDHWISITPSRPLPMGVHPGQGPLYVHQDRLRDAYLYVPKGAQDVGFGVTEEVSPYSWTMTVSDEAGKVLNTTTPRTAYSYYLNKSATQDALLKVSLTGKQPGCCLSVEGAPFVMCPDAETARKIHGGMEWRAPGVWTFFDCQRKLLDWAMSLKPEDLKYTGKPAETPFRLSPMYGTDSPTSNELPRLLETQDLDPASPTYGRFKNTGDKEFEQKFSRSGKGCGFPMAAQLNAPGNGYYQSPVLVRRAMLQTIMEDAMRLGPNLVFGHNDGPKTYPTIREDQFWGLPYRSGWYNFHDGGHSEILAQIGDLCDKTGVPSETMNAWRKTLQIWAYGRSQAHSGETTNQWIMHLQEMADAIDAIKGDADLEALMLRGVERWATPGVLGRVDPDPSPYVTKSRLGYGYACDLGWSGAGYPTDGGGFDAEYCNETMYYCRTFHARVKSKAMLDRFEEYTRLKAHLALPVNGTISDNLTCPTDMSNRTPFPSAPVPLFDAMKGRDYFDAFTYWSQMCNLKPGQPAPKAPAQTLPCLQESSFIRNFDNAFFFIKKPSYYTIMAGGETAKLWRGFMGVIHTANGSSEFLGSVTECGYGSRGMMAGKLAGLSSVFVPQAGPIILSSNQDVFYVNNLWTRSKNPGARNDKGMYIPEYDCAGYDTPWVQFNDDTGVMTRTGQFFNQPLSWVRTVVCDENRILVDVDITAMEDVDLMNLCESIPWYAVDNRVVRTFAGDWKEGDKIGVLPSRKAPPRHREPGEAAEAVPQDDTRLVPLRAVDISGPTGAGAAVIFPRQYDAVLIPPMSYQVQSLSISLSPRMKKGQRQTLHYVIVPHAKAITAEELKQIIP
ncbi:MAG: hypothetical protein IT440_04615 [Phycisphaeraceae bacterium]|nr:hypothetical protein [Phycisphaeraceae bacterium]